MKPEVGAKATVEVLGQSVIGEVVRVSETSVWIRLHHPSGTTPTFRYTRRTNGEYRKAGAGQYAAPVLFH
ncbi:hypothetical protein D477_002633 [Arthrobacter crystallopoietes BAB-32]|uniref:Uncharacterized protein n=1 Tax=Arthrobacter crystallopoietes BAB-32 TaxID=1246476 RepID=N1VBU6_9MICC|nr:hypothetical protein [Arthrobacter crystallopoietes]EMY35753.1 hypothetical protein D477_002633 [Arthrobacter crystallopoietes BAB-32]